MEKQDINGFLLLDKPCAMTSNRALQVVKRLFQAKKAGFLGTLDPFASGMLPICFGKATKAVERLHENNKIYQACIKLGERTATGDLEGEIIATKPVPLLTEAKVEALMQKFIGEIDQIPPLFSALKKNGVPLYKLARKGVFVEREARKAWVGHLRLIKLQGDRLEFEITSGKGFYVRVFAEDLAQALGTEGHLVMLRRLAAGGFNQQKMYSVEELNALALRGREHLESALLPVAS